MTNSVIVSDQASVLRAVSILRAFTAHDHDHLNEIMAVVSDPTDEHAAIFTLSALVWVAALLTDTLARTEGSTVDQTLDGTQHRLIQLITEGTDHR